MKFVYILVIFVWLSNSLKLKQDNAGKILKNLLKYDDVISNYLSNTTDNTLRNEMEESLIHYSNVTKYLQNRNGTSYEYENIISEAREYNENEPDRQKVAIKIINLLMSVLLNDQGSTIGKYGNDWLKCATDIDQMVNSSFLELTVKQDEEPPRPYTSPDLPCRSPQECAAKKMIWMK
jgi:hypothetical protein